MLRVGLGIREVVEPIGTFVGKDEEVSGGKVNEDRLGEVPLGC
jgi:hypothetical protein